LSYRKHAVVVEGEMNRWEGGPVVEMGKVFLGFRKY